MLSYGVATREGSPGAGDQLELFSKKRFRDAWITPEGIETNTTETVVRSDNTFINQEE